MVVATVILAACGGGDPAVRAPEDETTSISESDSASSTLTSIPVDDISANHVDPPVSFATSPSTGGDHYPFWQNCGYYNVEVPEGAATHTMEHGAVWITYNSDLASDEDLVALEALSVSNDRLLITPFDHDDTVVLSAWGVQQRDVPAASTPEGSAAIDEFVAAWVDNPELGEAGVRCDGAAGVSPDQPRLFPDGQIVPDEFN